MILGYFTAGVLILLGVLLMVKYGREMKVCYPAGAVFVILGIWWALNTLYPENPIIDGWLGWTVKCVAGAALLGLAVYFFVVRKKEVDRFEAEKEGNKRTTLYDNYDDFQFDDDKKPLQEDDETPSEKGQ
jgi:hypothetical protein